MYINSKIRAVFFDLDDTLLNTRLAEYNAICTFKKLFHEFDNIKDIEFYKLWNTIAIELYDEYIKRNITFKKLRLERIKRIFSICNVKIIDDEAKKKFNIYLSMYKKQWSLFDDAIKILKYLKGKYKLGIITNGDSVFQREKIQQMDISKYFSEIIISSEVGCSKPDKQIFEIACKKLDVKPNEAVMIGDKFEVDIKGSKEAGMISIWINRKNQNVNYKYQIKQLSELYTYI